MSLRSDTLVKRIGTGYLIIIIILITAVLVTVSQVKDMDKTVDRLSEQRQPTTNAYIRLLNGINHSTAALRGWILFQDNRFRIELAECQKDEIMEAHSSLQVLSADWENPKNVKRLTAITALLHQLNTYQKEVEQLVPTDPKAAADLMETQVIKLNRQIQQLLNEAMAEHDQLIMADFIHIKDQVAGLSFTEWMLLIIGVVLGLLLSVLITRSLSKPLTNAVQVANEIAAGNLKTEVSVGGFEEVNHLGDALKKMKEELYTVHLENKEYTWLTKGQNQLYAVIRGDQMINELSKKIIDFLVMYTHSSVGAIYLVNEEQEKIQVAATHAYGNDDWTFSLKKGEGIVGEVVLSKKTVLLDKVDEPNMRLKSSFINGVPKNILIVPFMFAGEVVGVIEIAKGEGYKQREIDFLEDNTETLGIAVNSALARKHIEDLLEETRLQSEELQQQQEELEQNNEELEEQTQSLKQQQEELQVTNEELEEQSQLIEEKNKDLEAARTDIELKAKQLEVTNKYKSEFLANMSHELRTPLNSLLILSKDLSKNAEGNLDDEQVESAEVINKCGYDLLNLINEILDLSKIEAGKMELNYSEVKLQEIENNIRRNFKKQAEKKGVNFIIEVEETVPEFIYTDQQRVEQVLKNLLSNAIKFTHEGEVKVTIGKDAGNNLAFSVKDTGIGIATDKKEAVFEAFQQADGSTSRKYGGTGLGLSISRELSRILGGRIDLESEAGKGSEFTLIIPAGKPKENQPKERVLKPTENLETPSKEQQKEFINYPTIADQRSDIKSTDQSLLIIEDDRNFAEILAKQANEKGFKYIAAGSGEDGLVLAEKFKPSAIILDIGLPGMDGNVVLAELKGSPGLRHIPVHVISGKEKTINPLKFGAVEFLQKPATKEQLQNAFDHIQTFVSRKMKNLLIVEDDENLRKSILKLMGNGDIKCHEAGTGEEALAIIEDMTVDCVVLDLGLPDMSGKALLKKLNALSEQAVKVPPVIIYTGKDLTREEDDELREYAETIIVKGVKSEERLLDETALFLHRTVNQLPKQKQEIINNLHNKETLFQNKKILLVDDDMRNIFALSKMLKAKGMIVTKADNGKTALKMLEKDAEMDLILMDIMMPEMDGYECMRQIREDEKISHLPIIALTAKAMKEDRKKCIDAGANDYITKPVDMDRLFSMMRIWMNS